MVSSVVEPEWLSQRLNDNDISILDCTWFVPEMNISGRELFEEAHIPGAQFIDLDEISDPTSPYVNMMPSAKLFAGVMGRLGIGHDTQVVVYNSNYVSARLWWMFQHFGHRRVSILDGGLQRWQAGGFPIETGKARPRNPTTFVVGNIAADIVTAEAVLSALREGTAAVVDVRPKGKFEGTEPTGYPGIAPGHMPGAYNLPWTQLLTPDSERRFLPSEKVAAALQELGIDLDKPIIVTCGSGITAAILAFHLNRIGHRNWQVYDGSWHEWGQRNDLPRETKK